MRELKNNILQSLHGRPFLADIFLRENGLKKPVVIFTHGFQGFKDWGAYDLMARQFAEADLVFVKYNSSHNGTTIEQPIDFADLEAFGNNNFSKELDDLGVVVDWVCSHKFPINKSEIDTDKIYLIGHSRGGGIVMLKAGEDKRIKKISTWASVNQYGKFWRPEQMEKIKAEGVMYVTNGRTKQQMPIYWQMYQDYFDHLKRLFIPDVVKALTIPMLIVHGSNDDTVGYEHATELKEWKPDAELLKIENGNHVFGASHPWIQDHLPDDLKKVIQETIRFFKK